MGRLLVCGGRDYADAAEVDRTLDGIRLLVGVEVLIHGDAPGADRLAAAWARDRAVPALAFPADWKAHGRAAGPIRNRAMLAQGRPTFVVAFPGGTGTAGMVALAREAGVAVLDIPRDRC